MKATPLIDQNPVISLDIFATIAALAKAPLEPTRDLAMK